MASQEIPEWNCINAFYCNRGQRAFKYEVENIRRRYTIDEHGKQ